MKIDHELDPLQQLKKIARGNHMFPRFCNSAWRFYQLCSFAILSICTNWLRHGKSVESCYSTSGLMILITIHLTLILKSYVLEHSSIVHHILRLNSTTLTLNISINHLKMLKDIACIHCYYLAIINTLQYHQTLKTVRIITFQISTKTIQNSRIGSDNGKCYSQCRLQ